MSITRLFPSNSHDFLQSRRPYALAGKPSRWMSEVLSMYPNSAKDQLNAGSRSFLAEDRQVAFPSAATRSASSSRTIPSWRACQSAGESYRKCHPKFFSKRSIFIYKVDSESGSKFVVQLPEHKARFDHLSVLSFQSFQGINHIMTLTSFENSAKRNPSSNQLSESKPEKQKNPKQHL